MPSKPSRELALDALRGLALLLMVASGLMPWAADQSLPAWMYHAQEPPPSHQFNPNLPGLTWVDLVFPLFLFALGAAIPLAYARRLDRPVLPIISENGSEKGSGEELERASTPEVLPLARRRFTLPLALQSGVLLHTLQRGVLLVWFALYRNYLTPDKLQPGPGRRAWTLGLLAFLLLFPMFTRLPNRWNAAARTLVRLIGFGGGAALFFSLYHNTGRHFSLGDSDIILMVLANMAVFGGLIWLCTRQNPRARWAIMALLVASRLASGPPGWVHTLYHASKLPFPPYWTFDWFFQLDFQKYLLIVLPGTLVGDMLLVWRDEMGQEQRDQPPPKVGQAEAGQEASKQESSPKNRWRLAALIGVCLPLILLIGLEARWLLPTTIIAWALCVCAVRLTASPVEPMERLLHCLIRQGSFWIVLGLMLEPFQGGIKKDSATLSYLFLTPGIACFLLGSFLVVGAIPRLRRFLMLLADVGQNPMIGYVGMDNFLLPLFGLIGLNTPLALWFTTPWSIALRATLETLLLAYFVRLCSRCKLYWRT